MPDVASMDTLIASSERQAQSSPASMECIKDRSTSETIEGHSAPPPRPRRTKSFRVQVEYLTSAALRPYWGLLCLGISIGSVFFSLAILVTSNDEPVDSWTIQPTVYLAIAAAISNTMITIAYTQATVIAWWYTASKGATIRKLERQWEVSTGLFSPRYHIKHPSLVVVATVLVWSMIADGPMLQRAASVVSATQSKAVPFNVTLSPELPTGFSGSRQYDFLFFSTSVSEVSQQWTRGDPIPFPVEPGCKGKCIGTVRGPGVTKEKCSTQTWPIDEDMFRDPNATWGRWPAVNSENVTAPRNPLFQIRMGPHMDGLGNPVPQEAAVLWVGSISVFNATGEYEETKCYWVPTILDYNVEFDSDGHVNILRDPESPADNPTGRIVALANNTRAVEQWVEPPDEKPTTIDYLVDYLRAFVVANASAAPPAESNEDYQVDVWHGDAYTWNPQALIYHNSSNGALDVNFRDPVPDIIQNLNDMLFRSSVLATTTWPNITELIDPGLSIQQHIVANETVTQNVFHSDFTWFAAATVLDLVVTLAVLPLFWGFWRLEKHLTLSPFSLALAFNAPLFREADPEHGVDGVVKDYGDMRIRYGEIVEGSSGGEMTESEEVGFNGGEEERGEDDEVSPRPSGIKPAERVNSMASSRRGFGRCTNVRRD